MKTELLHGALAFFVSRRSHEIGTRVALGATTRDIIGIVVRAALGLAVDPVRALSSA
jgi:hypothetical protein